MKSNRNILSSRHASAGAAVLVLATAALVAAPVLTASALSPVAVGTRPVGLGIDVSNHRVVVANSLQTTVSIFDGSAATPVAAPLDLGSAPFAVAVDSAFHLAYVTLPAVKKVAVIDIGVVTPVVLRTVAVGVGPSGVAVDLVSHNVFVTNNTDGTVSRFHGPDAAPVPDVSPAMLPGDNGIAVDSSNHTVFVASGNKIIMFNGSGALSALSTIDGASNAGAVAVDEQSHRVFVTDATNSKVIAFDGRQAAPTLSLESPSARPRWAWQLIPTPVRSM